MAKYGSLQRTYQEALMKRQYLAICDKKNSHLHKAKFYMTAFGPHFFLSWPWKPEVAEQDVKAE